MSALAYENKPDKKIVYGIRHAEAWHNILYTVLGLKAYSTFQDTTLTARGMQQAVNANPPKVDIVFVSPCLRTLQTASIMFPNTPKFALECLKEYPQEHDICNQRSAKSFLQKYFSDINFDDLKTEHQKWPNTEITPSKNKNIIDLIIEDISEERVALVSHSTWLKYYINENLNGDPELEHCVAYKL
jgi:phosphohistidine phosphatase SixA